jgi:hypothetical protein
MPMSVSGLLTASCGSRSAKTRDDVTGLVIDFIKPRCELAEEYCVSNSRGRASKSRSVARWAQIIYGVGPLLPPKRSLDDGRVSGPYFILSAQG